MTDDRTPAINSGAMVTGKVTGATIDARSNWCLVRKALVNLVVRSKTGLLNCVLIEVAKHSTHGSMQSALRGIREAARTVCAVFWLVVHGRWRTGSRLALSALQRQAQIYALDYAGGCYAVRCA